MPSYRNDTLLVKFYSDQGDETKRFVEDLTRGRVVWESRLLPGLSILKIPSGWVETYHEIVSLVYGVEYVRFDWIGQLQAPNDPMYPQQWWLQSSATLPVINAPCAWTVITEIADDKIIAVLDSGIDVAAPDIAPNMWQNSLEIPNNGNDDDLNGYCDDFHGIGFWGDGDYIGCNSPTACAINPPPALNTGSSECSNYHGTIVAFNIGAKGNNAAGSTGLAWKCRIMSVRVQGNFSEITDSSVIPGIEYAVLNGARIVNMSFVMNSPFPVSPDPLQDIMNAADDVLFVIAAGNQAQDITWTPPASFLRPQLFGLSNSIVVAGCQADDSRWLGPNSVGSNWSSTAVDLAAPANCMFGAYLPGCNPPTALCTPSTVNPCIFDSGTSYAAPLVSAAAGFVWTLNPTWTPQQVRTQLRSTVRLSPFWTGFVSTGGILDVAKAVGAQCVQGVPE